MNYRVLAILLFYYAFISLMFLFMPIDTEGVTTTNDFNSSIYGVNETDTGNMNLGRVLGLVTIGVGLPKSTPAWFRYSFIAWQTSILIITGAFIVDLIPFID